MICTIWVPIKKMIADGLTKALTMVKHKAFIKTTSLKDQQKCLAFIREKKDRKNAIQH